MTKEVIHMLTKFKAVLISAAVLVGGAASIAAAQGRDKSDQDRQAMHAERKAEMLARFDANKDGKLDDTEKDAMKAERAALQFSHLDKDGDGKLSLDEFKAAKHHQGRGGRGGSRDHGRGGFRGRH
jgi:Ca2+-binding EF-hand superfamily protein